MNDRFRLWWEKQIYLPPIALLILLHAHDNLLYVQINDTIYSPSLSFLLIPNSKE